MNPKPSVVIVCYPKVGSQFLKEMLSQRIRPANALGKVTTSHAFNIDGLKSTCEVVGTAPDVKFVYLYANPMNAVLALLTTFMPIRLRAYQPNLVRPTVEFPVAFSYQNFFACGGPAWTGATTLFENERYVNQVLSSTDREDIEKHFVSYMINGDVLGYKNHFDIWTKTYPHKTSHSFCMIKYEELENLNVLDQLRAFLGPSCPSLHCIKEEFIPRRTNYVGHAHAAALTKAYGELAAEMNSLPAFQVLS